MVQLWMVRSNGGDLVPTFLEKSIVSISWCSDVDFTGAKKEDFRRALNQEYPSSLKSVPTWVGICENFVNKMSINDYVLTYDSVLRVYYLGVITGGYKYNPKLTDSHTRAVNWFEKTVSRDSISNSTKNSLGSTLTIFRLSTEQKEEILNAMGYVARRSKKGADRGVDVFASPDGLGLEEPRIFVEVKHRAGQMGAPEIRKFIGGRKPEDKCLYVSTGGYTKEALYEAERSNVALTLIDINLLAETITRYYDHFSVEGKMLLPLKKVYIPA